jgi:membrane protein implicated in regulation of membrane protease activity
MNPLDWASHNDYAWLIAAVLFMALEAIGINGVGFLFSSFGAVLVGTALYCGLIENGAYVVQFSLFFISTAFWAYVLWKPLQKFHAGKRSTAYRNIVGDTAYVGSSGIDRKNGGEVTWSGTIMRAELAHGSAVDTVEAGSQVEVVDVKGATLIVKIKE